ncbi:MAG: hypothetical protein FWG85_00485 [Bacteroidetes bacterium]|nr:hypothetical protein [Bacteroidota bacterium]
MKKAIIFILSFYLVGNAFAYSRNYDVLKYNLYVDWSDILQSNKGEIEKRKWNGNMKITFVPKVDNLTEIELDAVGLKIDDISFKVVNEEMLDGSQNITLFDDKIRIEMSFLDYIITTKDTIELSIDYAYINPYNKGFSYRNSADTFPSDFVPDINAPSAGTLNEPQDARYWMPCNDVPSDKALWDIVVSVPVGIKAVSNGSLDSSVIYNDVETFYWSSKCPMPTYLMTIAAADYELRIERMQINSTDIDSVDVYYYTFPGDWEGENGCSAEKNLSTTQKAMQIFSDLFGNYPFEKYGYATVDYTHLGFRTLGMEHQTITTSNRYWVRNFIPVPTWTAFAHELGHHWFGNMVTCKEWTDLWFNEGGATWTEAIYSERINGYIDTAAYFNFMQSRRVSYIDYSKKDSNFYVPVGKIYNPDSALFQYSTLTYSKSSWIFHSLRVLLGDDIFPLCRKLLDEYKFGNISIYEFADFFVENVTNPPHNIDMKKFIEQFVIYGGHPKYIINTNVASNTAPFIINMNLIQTQEKTDNVIDDFLMYIKVDFFDSDDNFIKSEYIVNDKQEQDYTFILDKEPTKIIFDTTRSLLEIIENNLTSIENYTDNVIKIFPNPSNNNEINIASDLGISTIIITDLRGNTILSDLQPLNYFSNNYTFLLPNIETGTYFIIINSKNIYKLIVAE